MLAVVLLFGCTQFSNSPVNTADAATKKITFTNIDQYAEVHTTKDLKISWTASGGTVNYYTFALRYLYNKRDFQNILVYGDTKVSKSAASFTIPHGYLKNSGLYRYSVSAVMTDGSQVWSEERYFYGECHEPLTKTFNFYIYNGLEEASKNAAYYAVQSWAKALGKEYVSTYPFSMGTDEKGTIDESDEETGANGQNCISIAYYGPGSNVVGRTKVRRNIITNQIAEMDVYLNKSNMKFYNGSKTGCYDVQSILAHEVGHLYGLCDKYELGSYNWCANWTMNGFALTNDISRRSLESYDKKQLLSLYS